jgi:hypothetical protein
MVTVSADALPAVGATLASLDSVTSLIEFLFSGLHEGDPILGGWGPGAGIGRR